MGAGRGASRRAQAVGIEGPVLSVRGTFYFYDGSVYLSTDKQDWGSRSLQGNSIRELLYGAALINREILITIENEEATLASASGMLREDDDGVHLLVGDKPLVGLFHGVGGSRVDVTAMLLSDARRVASGETVAAKRVSF